MESFSYSVDKINYQALARSTATETEISKQESYVIYKAPACDHIGEIVCFAVQEDHRNIQINLKCLLNLKIGDETPVLGKFLQLNEEINSIFHEWRADQISNRKQHLKEWENSRALKSYSCKSTWSRWMDESQLIVTKTHRSVNI